MGKKDVRKRKLAEIKAEEKKKEENVVVLPAKRISDEPPQKKVCLIT